MENQLQNLYDEMGRPGVQTFLISARKKSIQITEKQAKEFVGKQRIGLVFQGGIKSDGKINRACTSPALR